MSFVSLIFAGCKSCRLKVVEMFHNGTLETSLDLSAPWLAWLWASYRCAAWEKYIKGAENKRLWKSRLNGP